MQPDTLRALLRWDEQATLALNGLLGLPPPRLWELAWQAITLFGTAAVAIPVTAAAWEGPAMGWRRLATRAAVGMAAVGIASSLATLVLKPWFARPRPVVTLAGVHVVGVPLQRLGFPSGHATAAGAGAAAVVLLQRRRRGVVAAAVVGAGLVGASRIALGHHFALDVVAGLTFGAMIAAPLAAWGLRRFAPERGAGPPGLLPAAPPGGPPAAPDTPSSAAGGSGRSAGRGPGPPVSSGSPTPLEASAAPAPLVAPPESERA